jgi:hypothetical protein
MVLRVIGIAFAAALCWGAYLALENYGQFANVARWTGDNDLRWLRPWLTEFRMPLLCIAGFLSLSVLSWLWQKLRLGH